MSYQAEEEIPLELLEQDPEARAALAAIKPFKRRQSQGLELLKLSDLRNLPKPEWLVRGLIPTDSFATVYGPSNAGKSFWALDLALCIAAGIPFHGRPTVQGRVLYGVGEGMRGITMRIDAWLKAHPEVDEAIIEENLLLISRAVRFLSEDDAGLLLETAETFEDLRLFVVDTWARALVGGNENDSSDSQTAISVCDSVRQLFSKTEHGCTTLVIHHTGADVSKERGSTALRASSDTSLSVKQIEGIVILTVEKQKDGPTGEQCNYTLREVDQSCILSEIASQSPFPTNRGNTPPKGGGQPWSRFGNNDASPF